MPRRSTRENKNIYQLSRERAGFTREAAADRLEFITAARLEKIENRLDLIRRLERKYGMDAGEINRMQEELEEEYDELDGLTERISEMAKEHKQLLAKYRSAARALTESRKALARPGGASRSVTVRKR